MVWADGGSAIGKVESDKGGMARSIDKDGETSVIDKTWSKVTSGGEGANRVMKLSSEWRTKTSKTLKGGLETLGILIGETNVSFITWVEESKSVMGIEANGKNPSWKITSLEIKRVFVDKSKTL